MTVKNTFLHKKLNHRTIEILYEDDFLCVINKPAGLLSVPYSGSNEKNAQQILEEIMRKNGTFNNKHKPYPVHRLDRETSGVMMFALNENAQKKIMDGWHKIVTERLYIAIAENPRNKALFLKDSGLIDDDLAFNAHNIGYVPKNEKNVKTVPARTNYKILERGKTHTLFELSLDTGKKNQIRAHLASKGYPLAGDKNYHAKTDNFGRLCLHARTLEFTHPFTNELLKFEVKEPVEWMEYVKKGDTGNFTFAHKNVELGQKRLSKKERAHMNFIEAGKSFGK